MCCVHIVEGSAYECTFLDFELGLAQYLCMSCYLVLCLTLFELGQLFFIAQYLCMSCYLVFCFHSSVVLSQVQLVYVIIRPRRLSYIMWRYKG